MTEMKGMTEHRDDRLDGLPIHYVSNHREGAESMVVLLPAAQSANREDRSRRYYARWTWYPSWPESLVVAVADPAIQQSLELNGAWFIHREHDVIAAIAGVIADIATEAGIRAERIVFYGSSLGGFGALGCAAHLPGSKAVAEVPQIDFANWGKLAIMAVEDLVLGESISQFRDKHPERIEVTSRFQYAAFIPNFTIVSNLEDRGINDQRALVEWCHGSSLPRVGLQALKLTTLATGHKPLPREKAVLNVVP